MSFSDIRYILASDTLLASFIPLIILVIGYKHFSFNVSNLRDLLSVGYRKRPVYGYFSLPRAYFSFDQYAQLSARELSKMRASYRKLGRANEKIGFKIGYPKKLDRLQEEIANNATITAGITSLALDEFPSLKTNVDAPIDPNSADLGRVRESLKHYVRDWSSEGKPERARIFAPILKLLQKVPANSRQDLKVLVPGCGLGRLAWEISELGFDTTANELSYFMILALRFLCSEKTTKSVNQHNLAPYAHWFSHQLTNESLFRQISFPDVLPRFSSNFHLAEGDFLELKAPLSHTSHLKGYDFIITLFFIDTSLDVLATLNHIYNLLKPGGTWVNLGPLLWTGGGQAKLELSLEEVLLAVEEIGFILNAGKTGAGSRKTIECEYTGDKNAMMRWIYKAEFWVATKPQSL
ncbi:Carnosine N-methyltransferase [Psilocybe cubensis]|uniref:Carnosine N-methyltransferase n=2 Tax=Psilocybe cubensis TaxID=181762 RepID=A0ACB8HD48_PSICU|nr:Carnosine N-methyltransferase [Psilocybe cubensis]KAH9485642.1 Carnosine N-methyltransferase [Psilocybe cubensis]